MKFPANEPEKLAAFYENIFDWKFSKWPGPEDYWLIKTGEGVPKMAIPGVGRLAYCKDPKASSSACCKTIPRRPDRRLQYW